METIKTLTPLQIWNDFNPIKESLEINVMSRVIDGDIETTEYSFTAIYTLDGRARTYVKIINRLGAVNPPTIVYIPDFYEVGSRDKNGYIEAGFAVAEFDYSGKLSGKKNFATYPKSLSFANITQAGDRLTSAKYGAKETSQFVWCKVTRRVLTLIKSLARFSGSSLIGMARSDSGSLLWQVAGIDSRFDAIVPLLNGGYGEYAGHHKYGQDPVPLYDEERTRWNAGCSVQAYAKFLTAQVYCIMASNDKKYSMDRMWDTMSLLSDQVSHRELINFGLEGQLFESGADSVKKWLKDLFIDKTRLATPPTVNCKVDDGKLVCEINCDSNEYITSLELYNAYGESNNRYRNWYSQSLGADIAGKAKAIIKVYDASVPLFIVANVGYKGGLKLSSEMIVVKPDTLGSVNLSAMSQRIIFEKKMGIRAFQPKTNNQLVKDDCISLKAGPMDITGITITTGDLWCYNIGDVRCKEDGTLLQLDLYSDSQHEITLGLLDSQGKKYLATVVLSEGEEWTRAQVSAGDFKDSGFMPLKNWREVKSLIIIQADKILVNNIIWV